MIYKSNASEVINKLTKGLFSKNVQSDIVEEIASDILDSNKLRIHVKGLKLDNTKIGNYKIGPYKDWRRKQGLKTSYVDLYVYGNLRNSFSMQKLGNSFILGFNGFKYSQVAEYMEIKFGKIWGISKKDLEAAQNTVQKYVKKYA